MASVDFNELFGFDLWNEGEMVVQGKAEEQDGIFTPSGLSYTGKEFGRADPFFQGAETTDMDTSNIRFRSESCVSSEKSPWHESDSGMSTMSETGSIAPSDFSASDLPLQLPLSQWPEGEHDLAAYLLGADVPVVNDQNSLPDQNCVFSNNELHDFDNSESASVTDSSATYQNLSTLGVEEDINVENSDSECSNDGNLSPPRSNENPSTHALNYYQDIVLPPVQKSKPAVKIVKVLKATTTSDCCDDDIVKALDERSKKNAIQAKLNREKKKKYVSGLETDVEKLTHENAELREKNAELNKEVGSLEEEVRYLKSVLMNASALSGLLKNIESVSEVKLSASIVGKKRRANTSDDDHSYTATGGSSEGSRIMRSAKRAKLVRENLEKAGVCLHVNGGEASLEFCARCSSLSRQSHS